MLKLLEEVEEHLLVVVTHFERLGLRAQHELEAHVVLREDQREREQAQKEREREAIPMIRWARDT